MSEQRNKKMVFAWHVLFALTVIFLLVKCRYGYGDMDETFYVSIPWRVLRGDSLLLQEWHPSQLAGFLMLPLVKVYLMIFGNMEGSVLYFRIIYTLVWSLAAYFFYFRLKKLSLLGGMFASLAFLIYAPFGIMALGYNTLGIIMLVNAGVMISTNEHHQFGWDYLAGLAFAGAVLCCPYLIAEYAIMTIMMFFLAIRNRRKYLTFWLRFSVGCVSLLIIFCLALLSRGTPAEYINAIPELLNDPEHPPLKLLTKATNYFWSIYTSNKYVLPCVTITFLSFFLRKTHPALSFAFVGGTCLITLCGYWGTYPNYYMFPVNILGLYCGLCLIKQRLWKRLFWGLLIPGAGYTYCLHLSSNQRFYAISSASAVMLVASLVFIILYLGSESVQKDQISKKEIVAVVLFLLAFIPLEKFPLRWSIPVAAGSTILLHFISRCSSRKDAHLLGKVFVTGMTVLLVCIQLAGEYYLRWNFTYGEAEISSMNTTIHSGLENGIRTTEEMAERYTLLEKDMEIIRKDARINQLLVLSNEIPIIYLSTDKDIAAYSAWLSGVDVFSLTRLDRYYEQNPSKAPDAVYIKSDYTSYSEWFLARGYVEKTLPTGAILLFPEN